MRSALLFLSLLIACETSHRGTRPDEDASAHRDAAASGDAGSLRDAAVDATMSERDGGMDEDAGESRPAELDSLCVGCPSGQKACGGKCTSRSNPAVGCDDYACEPCELPRAKPRCGASGTCEVDECAAGWGDCDGDAANGCEADLSDPAHCGACGSENACTAEAALCSPTGCVASCGAGLAQCGSSCVDLAESSAHCGTCDTVCSYPTPGFVPACESGACTGQCFLGRTLNGGECVAPATNPACQAGLSQCGDACVALQADPAHCGRCARMCDTSEACVDGACVGSSRWLVRDLSEPTDIVLDETHVFWTDVGDDTVKAVAKIGGTVITIATGQQRPTSPVLDATHIYWSNNSGGRIMRARKDGSSPPEQVGTATDPRSIAVDSEYLYFPGDGGIDRVLKSGGTPSQFKALAADSTHTGVTIRSLVVDGTSLYASSSQRPGAVWRIALPAGDVTRFDFAAHRPSLGYDTFDGMVVAGSNIYVEDDGYATNRRIIHWLDKTNGEYVGRTVATADPALQDFPRRDVVAMAAASCGLFWTHGDDLHLSRVGDPLAPAIVRGKVRGVAVDASSIYWTDADGALGKIPML